jgi:hypothetical protein
VLVFDAGEAEGQGGIVDGAFLGGSDVAGRVRQDLGRPQLPEEHVAEGAGVPQTLDGNPMRAHQVIDGRSLAVGALELELDLDRVDVGEQAKSLGGDDAALGRGSERD